MRTVTEEKSIFLSLSATKKLRNAKDNLESGMKESFDVFEESQRQSK